VDAEHLEFTADSADDSLAGPHAQHVHCISRVSVHGRERDLAEIRDSFIEVVRVSNKCQRIVDLIHGFPSEGVLAATLGP